MHKENLKPPQKKKNIEYKINYNSSLEFFFIFHEFVMKEIPLSYNVSSQVKVMVWFPTFISSLIENKPKRQTLATHVDPFPPSHPTLKIPA